MYYLTPRTKKIDHLKYQTTESFFGAGIQGLFALFLLLGALTLPSIASFVIIFFTSIPLLLNTVYVINFQELNFQNYWSIAFIKIKRGNLKKFKKPTQVLIRRDDYVTESGNMEFAGGTSIQHIQKVKGQNTIHIQTKGFSKKTYVGEFYYEHLAAAELYKICQHFDCSAYMVKVAPNRQLNMELLSQGKIKRLAVKSQQ